jgi:hypothetical protein
MTRKIRITPAVGIFTLVCAAAVLLPAGCESSNRVVSVEPSPTCPQCERVTRIQPLTGLKYTTVVCPTCEKVYTLDPQVLNAIERFTGPNIGDRVHVCDSCGTVIEDCAACREKRVSRGG